MATWGYMYPSLSLSRLRFRLVSVFDHLLSGLASGQFLKNQIFCPDLDQSVSDCVGQILCMWECVPLLINHLPTIYLATMDDDEYQATWLLSMWCLHQYITLFITIILTGTSSLLLSLTEQEPYHTSILTGEGWVTELLDGHPEYICCEIGVHCHVFLELIQERWQLGHDRSKYVSLEEQLAISQSLGWWSDMLGSASSNQMKQYHGEQLYYQDGSTILTWCYHNS